jgi:hypothetical protein
MEASLAGEELSRRIAWKINHSFSPPNFENNNLKNIMDRINVGVFGL